MYTTVVTNNNPKLGEEIEEILQMDLRVGHVQRNENQNL